MNDSFENSAKSKLTKLAAATLACSVLCLIPNGFLAMLGYLGINLVMVFGFVFYRNRMAYSKISTCSRTTATFTGPYSGDASGSTCLQQCSAAGLCIS